MTPAFLAAFKRLIGHEGGFQSIPSDDGNWTGGAEGHGENRGTKFGISARSYPTLDIANLTLEEAQAIYWRDFWKAVRADRLPGEMGFQLFDAAVHSGAQRAVMLMQRALGLPDDGVWGPKTEAKFAIAVNAPAVLLARFNGVRLDFLTRTPRWPEFAKGWARRIAANLQSIT